jgi:hypothetical protein
MSKTGKIHIMATTSLPLFDTQLAAHAQVRPSKRDTYARILTYAEQCGPRGFTSDEAAVDFDCSHNHMSPRIGELVRSGELIITGRCRPTRSGCLARVFVARQFPTQRRADLPEPAKNYRLFPDDVPSRHLDLG